MRKYPLQIFLLITTTIASGCICYNISENLGAIEQAAETSNTTICNDMDETMQTVCYTSIAASTGNLSICESIKDANMNDGCYLAVAVNKENPDVCDKIKNPDSKDSCITQIASKTKDNSICNRLKQEARKQECLQSYTGGN